MGQSQQLEVDAPGSWVSYRQLMHTLGDVVLIAEDTHQATRNVYTGDRLPVSLKA